MIIKKIRWFWSVLLVGLFFSSIKPAMAHPAVFTSAHIYIQVDGRFQLFTSFDLLAFALEKSSLEISDPPMNALLDGPQDVLANKIEEARTNFSRNLKLQSDQGAGIISNFKFPTLKDVNKWKLSGAKPRLPVVANVEADGCLPENASLVRFAFPVALSEQENKMDN